MKKLAIVLLTVVYMLSIVGIAVSQFYCCSKLKSVTLSLNGSENKTSKKEVKEDGCCKTTHQYLKIKDVHLYAEAVSSPVKHFLIFHTAFPALDLTAFEKQQALISNSINAPPLITTTPAYVLNRVFRI